MTIAEVNKKYNTNLPEILMPDEIGNPEKWEKEGRARLKDILQREEYGRFPEYDKKDTTFKIIAEAKVPNKEILRRQIEITVNIITYRSRSTVNLVPASRIYGKVGY